MASDVGPLSLDTARQLSGTTLVFYLAFRSLIVGYFLSCSTASASLLGTEHDYGISPKFVCTPIPPEADPSCYSPPSVPHGANGHANGHNGSNRRVVISDEAKATILHLRESLVRQKETILDQRETIRELTAKLTLCEGFGGHHGNSHHDSHHDNHHDDHYDEHLGHHGSQHTPSHHASYHGTDHHFSHGSHRPDLHHREGSSYGKHSTFSPEQTGKTLQTLKERLENLQARNSSSSYSSSLRELLQRKINALEEQLHSYYRDHHEDHNEDHHDDHRDGDHHDDNHGNGHHEDHHESHRSNHHGVRHYNHHGDHRNRHRDYHPDTHDLHSGRRYGRYGNHHDDLQGHRDDHHEDHHEDHHGGDHHDNHHEGHPGGDHHDDHHEDHHGGAHRDDHHAGDHLPRRLPFSSKETSPRSNGHGKLETVLSQLHHSHSDYGSHKKLKSSSGFLLDFPMRTNYMYARMKRSLVTEIFALTVCLRLKGGTGPGVGTPFSYAVPGQANELVLMEWGSNPMELLINDKAVTLPVTMTDRKWHHLCVTWSTRDGVWEVYQDGARKGSGQNLSAWHSIKPGGMFLLGQEQDTMGGRFDVTQSFMGEMSDLQFWSRVLTPAEIYSQATCGGHLVGDIVSWEQESVELHGGLAEFPFDPCH